MAAFGRPDFPEISEIFGISELPGFAVGLFREFSDLFGFLIGLAVRVRLFSGFLEVFWGFRDSQTFESSDFSP